ncbi:hypothetical protein FQR65_LT03533 [Abscondita terminalis]|nr:hypothetical protein FQR65_LT03533 [Abscondita terminalis]
MKVAIEGCAHGELETIYETIKQLEDKEDIKVDLLIICGDFQACRNEDDLHCMAVPQKYYNMQSFYKYYNGEKDAPILTVFIGGNHEASNYLQELPYGGWVAPNIYYLGYSGVLNVAGVRIAGISGIYKSQDYLKGRFEKPPYTNDSKRSVYHIRNLDVFRLKQLTHPIDIFLSHDWPNDIWSYGNAKQLLKFKPYFKDDMESNKLGSKPAHDLMMHLQPKYYFAAHLHCKFAALVKHKDEKKLTRFLALDKCLPKRRFLQVIDVPHDAALKIELRYDLEWLTILRTTNHLISVRETLNYLPGSTSKERWNFTPSDEEKSDTLSKFGEDLIIPKNFVKTVGGYNPDRTKERHAKQPLPKINSQTTVFCKSLGVDDPLNLLGALTAELKFDSSVSDDDSTSTEEENSDVYETFIKTTPVKLSLPPPVHDCSVSADLSEISTCLSVNESVVEEENSPSHPKKFKRRNASLYCNEDSK